MRRSRPAIMFPDESQILDWFYYTKNGNYYRTNGILE